MKVLILAPQPFYQERGTPIAIDWVCQALSNRGVDVDVLTFHEGEDRKHKNVRIFRAKPWFAIKNIKPGFSVKKLICDVFMFFSFIRILNRNKYNVIHAVEESAFMALIAYPFSKIPFVYGIDSSMTTQLVDKFSFLKVVEGLLRLMESLPVRYAQVAAPVCQALADDIAKYKPKNVVILKDASLASDTPIDNIPSLRNELGIEGSLIMYIGNLESYQGIDLLIDSFAIACKDLNNLALVIIGGSDEDISKYKAKVEKQNLESSVFIIGKRPISDISGYMAQADVLVSPRVQGKNTPMKIYTYLDSDVAVLATNLPTHTQVMTPDIGVLAEPNTKDFSRGIINIVGDKGLREKLASNAKVYIEKEHSFEAFSRTVEKIYDLFPNTIK